MNAMVDDAVYTCAYARHGDYRLDGQDISLALAATKRDPDRPPRPDNRTFVRLVITDRKTNHIRHDMALYGPYGGSGPAIQYFDHHYGQASGGEDYMRERASARLQGGPLRLGDVALGKFPEFAEIAHTLRGIATQVASERKDRLWLLRHTSGQAQVQYYNGLQHAMYNLGRFASHFIRPKH